jgi:deltex-like protein
VRACTVWDRRLCVSVGTSATTGARNRVVWNIHHKTAMKGGVQAHGYPDEGYLERVGWELKSYGIE